MDISYNETADGIVKVSIEGTEFIDESRCYHIEKKTDKLTGFITPYWGYLSDVNKENTSTYLILAAGIFPQRTRTIWVS